MSTTPPSFFDAPALLVGDTRSFAEQMHLLRTQLTGEGPTNVNVLWSMIELGRPYKNTMYDLGVGFDSPEDITNWISQHPFPWQALLEVLRNPFQTWSADRKYPALVLTTLFKRGLPDTVVEQTALGEAVYSLLDTPVWRPHSLNALRNLCESQPHIIWKLPNLGAVDFVQYRHTPLTFLLTSNLAQGSNLTSTPLVSTMLATYWTALSARDLPSDLAYHVLTEVLNWTDANWELATLSVRTKEQTWSLVAKWAPRQMQLWKDLLDNDPDPHLALSAHLRKSLKKLPKAKDTTPNVLDGLDLNLSDTTFF